MTLRTRLAWGLITIAVLLVVPLVIAVQALDRLHRDTRALRDNEFAASLLLGRLREGLNELRRKETALLFVHDAASRDAMDKQVNIVRGLADSLKGYALNQSASDINSSITEIVRWAPPEYRAALADSSKAAEQISAGHMVPALGVADGGVLRAERDLRERTASRVEGEATAISRAKSVTVVALLLALAVAAGISIWLTRYISRPVEELERGMGAVADGDFAVKLPLATDRADEFGRLAASFERMSAQLAELDKLKAEFVSIASHELKTPINVVLGYLQLLEEGIYGPLTPEQKDIHVTLESQVQSLGRLVQQLLDISRFEAGGSKLEPHPFPLSPFLDEMEQSFQVLAHQRGIRFMVMRRDGLPAEVTWDRDRMSEVLGNLLSNAFKFTERGGEVELSVDTNDDMVHIDVRDTGAGIAQDQLPHVFEKFYQADNQKSASAKGTGLGLAIAKNIVEAHHGTISCESTAGVGTTFAIALPARVTGRRSSAQRVHAVGVA